MTALQAWVEWLHANNYPFDFRFDTPPPKRVLALLSELYLPDWWADSQTEADLLDAFELCGLDMEGLR